MEKPDIYRLIQKHYEQIDLFYYQNNKVLTRPKTTLAIAFIWCLIYILVISFCVVLNIIVEQPLYYEIPISVIVYLFTSETLLKFIGIKIVECYQHYAKEETRRKCLCVPSCSEYAILCLKKYELIYALLKIRKRLFVTCKGYDYIIDYP